MADFEIIKFKNIEIVYTDLSNSTTSECLEAVQKIQQHITSQPPKSVLSLVNVNNVRINKNLLGKFIEIARGTKPYVLATAVFGVNAFTKVLLDTVVAFTGKNIVALDSFEEGQLWLHDQYQQKNIVA